MDRITGQFFDYLSRQEVVYSKQCYEYLLRTAGNEKLLSDPAVRRVWSLSAPVANFDQMREIKSACFELRVARDLQCLGLLSEYEVPRSKEARKTVDFKFSLPSGVTCFLELTNTMESDQQKKSTEVHNFGAVKSFGYDPGLEEAKEAGELLGYEYKKVCDVLIKKALKFSSNLECGCINAILVNCSALYFGLLDRKDFGHIVYGCHPQDPERISTKDGPWNGLLSTIGPENQEGGSERFQHIQQSIHYFGFVVEKGYLEGRLLRSIIWLPNTLMEKNEQAAVAMDASSSFFSSG